MEVRLFQQFKNYIEVADTYKQSTNIYFFIKYYAFSKFCNVAMNLNLNEVDRLQLEQMIAQFNSELAQAQWNYQCMTKDEYVAFLEKFYEGIDFNSADLYLLTVAKDILEILSFFGEFDDLANRRMNFFNRKISALESPSQNTTQPQTQKTSQTTTMTTTTTSTPQQTSGTKTGKASTSSSMPQTKQTAPTSSAVSAIHEVKQSSSSGDSIPKLLDKSIKLPIRKTDSSFTKVKELISMHIEYANLELDFHKLENAKDHIEAAIYYLRNIEN